MGLLGFNESTRAAHRATGAVHDGSRVPSTDAVPIPLRILDHIYGTVYGSTVAVQTRDLTAVYGRCTAVRQVKFKAYI